MAKSKSTFLSRGLQDMVEGRVIAKMCTFSSLLFIHFNRNCSNLRSETSLWTENPSQVSTHTLDLCLLFQDIDKFGNEITQLARPLPVEWQGAGLGLSPTSLRMRASHCQLPPAGTRALQSPSLLAAYPAMFERQAGCASGLESGGFPRACGRV